MDLLKRSICVYLSLALAGCGIRSAASNGASPATHRDGLGPSSKFAMGLLGDRERDEFFRLRAIILSDDQKLLRRIEKAIQDPELKSQSVSTFESNVYAILFDSNGNASKGAAFNSGWVQPVECKGTIKRLMVRPSRIYPQMSYWGPAPGLSEAIRSAMER